MPENATVRIGGVGLSRVEHAGTLGARVPISIQEFHLVGDDFLNG